MNKKLINLMKYMNNSNIILITRNNATLFFKISIIKFKKKWIKNELI